MSTISLPSRQSWWQSQPFKGLLFIGVIAAVSWIFDLFLSQIFQLDENTKLTYITIFFAWWWHLGFSLNGYPGDRFFSNRLGRGTINLAVLLVLSYLTGELWKFISVSTNLTDTPAGLWGQTAIIAAAASLFFFDNILVTTDQNRHSYPASGFFNIFFAIFFIAPALTFLPKLWGLDPFYIPWYWYPLSTVFGSFFERWPLSRFDFKQPQLGVLHTGIVLLLTLVMALVLQQSGIDLFTTTNGPVFAAIWTTVGLGLLWQFNLWPFTQLAQPIKGLVTSLVSLVITALLYELTLVIFGESNILQGLYWWFNILWVQVFLMAPGLYDGIGLWQRQPISTVE